MQSSKSLTPGVSDIQRNYIDSFLNYVILRVLGGLSEEELEKLGGESSSLLSFNSLLPYIRSVIEMFTPYIFILDTLSKPDRRSGGLVSIIVNSAKQTIQLVGREAPHIGSIIGFGVVGELVGWAIAIPIWATGIAVGVSSKDPKFVIKSAAGFLPIISSDVQNAVEASDSIATKIANKSSSIFDSIKSAANAVAENSAYSKTDDEPSADETSLQEPPSN